MGVDGGWVVRMKKGRSMPEVEILEDALALAHAAVLKFTALADEAIMESGHFVVALSGGSTPQNLYMLLAQPRYISGIDWSKVHIFWGDERCVRPDHPDSNYRMAQLALLDLVHLPIENIHRIHGELAPAQAAARYEDELHHFFGSRALPRFDLILLGMGDDGHTASLFPGSAALLEQERWVLAVDHAAPPLPLVPRITLTLPVLNAAANVIFLVSGSSKAEKLAQALHNIVAPQPLPVQLIRPLNGSLLWLVDRAAAEKLAAGG
jgi:6-phosphogluconolactonase